MNADKITQTHVFAVGTKHLYKMFSVCLFPPPGLFSSNARVFATLPFLYSSCFCSDKIRNVTVERRGRLVGAGFLMESVNDRNRLSVYLAHTSIQTWMGEPVVQHAIKPYNML